MPYLLRLLWTSDRPVAGTSTWQPKTQQRDVYAPGGIRTTNSSKRATAHPRLRQHNHCYRP